MQNPEDGLMEPWAGYDREAASGTPADTAPVETTPAERLEYLRGELRAERISYGDLAELQSLVEHIDPGDVELLEAAGVPEFPPERAKPEWDEEPTILIGVADGALVEVSVRGCPVHYTPPGGFRVILRDWDKGNEPDDDGDLYVDSDVTAEVGGVKHG